MNEEAVDLAPEGVGVARVGAARVSRRPRRAREPCLFDAPPARREARAVEKAGVVEPRGEAGDVLEAGRLLAMADRDDAVDLGHGVVAVEQGDDVERWNGQKDDLLGEVLRADDDGGMSPTSKKREKNDER